MSPRSGWAAWARRSRRCGAYHSLPDTSQTACYLPPITQDDLRGQFYAHGEIGEIRMVPERRCALVTYRSRSSAEEAAKASRCFCPLPQTLPPLVFNHLS